MARLLEFNAAVRQSVTFERACALDLCWLIMEDDLLGIL